jgi:hypothetical protein
MVTVTQLFELGNTYQTPGVLEVIRSEDVLQALARHQEGDWGDLGNEDKEDNDKAVWMGGRLFSAYCAATGEKFWVITEADRTTTTVLLPEGVCPTFYTQGGPVI